jgi:hypothetical protein
MLMFYNLLFLGIRVYIYLYKNKLQYGILVFLR